MTAKVIIDSSILLKRIGGEIILEIDGGTIGECVEKIILKYPFLREELFNDEGKLYPDALFTINGEGILTDIESRKIEEGDEIKVIRFAGS
jgi:hypothetical protein